MQKWILPTLSEVITLSESTLVSCTSEKAEKTAKQRVKAEREWWVALAAAEQLLLQSLDLEAPSLTTDSQYRHENAMPLPSFQGLVFAGPVPVLSHIPLLSSLQSWVFTAESLQLRAGTPFQLPPAILNSQNQTSSHTAQEAATAGSLVPLLPDDPLSSEQFCLILTARFSLVMVLGEDTSGTPAFMFSFEPEVVEQVWKALRARIVITSPKLSVAQLDALVEQYYPVIPDYRTIMQFSRLLLKQLPEQEGARDLGLGASGDSSLALGSSEGFSKDSFPSRQPLPDRPSQRPDVELLQAFAHEVRTPLTTIRTLIRLLLKRRDLAADAIERLKVIDRECTEQIDRMELLFRAAELETSTVKAQGARLTAMSLAQVLQHSIPRWQQSASRRNLTLDVVLPQQLPTVVSDPRMLDQVLSGLIENFTRSLPAGSHIQVQVIPAGDQLKLQLLHETQTGKSDKAAQQFPVPPICKSLGQLLIFQPETGNISLNLTATKQLFQAIGGKLIVRHRPYQGEVLTVFLPLQEGQRSTQQGAGERMGAKSRKW